MGDGWFMEGWCAPVREVVAPRSCGLRQVSSGTITALVFLMLIVKRDARRDDLANIGLELCGLLQQCMQNIMDDLTPPRCRVQFPIFLVLRVLVVFCSVRLALWTLP